MKGPFFFNFSFSLINRMSVRGFMSHQSHLTLVDFPPTPSVALTQQFFFLHDFKYVSIKRLNVQLRMNLKEDGRVNAAAEETGTDTHTHACTS